MTLTLNQTTFQSKNGRFIHVRPIQAGDAPLLVSIFEHMSSDSRYQRFHQTMDSVEPQRVAQEADQMVADMADNSFGLIAFEDKLPVGAARYVIFAEGKADTAVSIRDDYQNSGIGTTLIALLAQEAQSYGLTKLTVSTQAANKAALRILEKLPYARAQQLDGAVVEIEIDLSNPVK